MANVSSMRHDLSMFELSPMASDGLILYVVVSGLVMVDAIFPVAPSETLLVAGGALVAAGDASLIPLVAAGALGAVAGHLLLYALGAHAGPALVTKMLRGRFRQQQFEKAARNLNRRPWLLIVADFVPWGRTILMFSAGALRVTRARFIVFASVAALVWASFFAVVGFIGGSVFESTWYSLAASLGVVLAIGFVSELIQRRIRGGKATPI